METVNPSKWAESYVHFIHDITGLPWWATIVLTVVSVRTVLFPITLKQIRASTIMKQIGPEMTDVLTRMNTARVEK